MPTPPRSYLFPNPTLFRSATVGQLDNDALFYLGSRGMDQQTARALLTTAFAHETLTHLPQGPLREQLTALTGTTLTHQAGGEPPDALSHG